MNKRLVLCECALTLTLGLIVIRSSIKKSHVAGPRTSLQSVLITLITLISQMSEPCARSCFQNQTPRRRLYSHECQHQTQSRPNPSLLRDPEPPTLGSKSQSQSQNPDPEPSLDKAEYKNVGIPCPIPCLCLFKQ